MTKNLHSLKKYNGFKLDVYTSNYIEFTAANELVYLIRNEPELFDKYFVLGEGSNTLFVNNYDGLIIKPLNKEISMHNDGEHVYVEAGAGLNWDKFVSKCVSQRLGGLENLTLIPGTVGAAPVQNIGAYGVEVAECIEWVEVIDTITGKVLRLTNKECGFSYRNSIFKKKSNKYVVHKVCFKLIKKTKTMEVKKIIGVLLINPFSIVGKVLRCIRLERSSKIKLRMNFEQIRYLLSMDWLPIGIKRYIVKNIRTKTMKLPEEIGNVGCFFKSPILDKEASSKFSQQHNNITVYDEGDGRLKVSAGELIKAVGMAGARVHDVGTDSRRPLVIYNYGAANGRDIRNFANEIINRVESEYGIILSPEVVYVTNGEDE